MTTIEHVTAVPQDGDEDGGFSRSVWTAVGVFAALLVAFWFFWPAGVVLGLAAGVLVTVRFGQHMHAAAQSVPTADGLTVEDDELWQEFRRLRVRLGDDFADFSRAAVVVTRRQSASAATLRTDLGASTAQAQHLLDLLEREGFVSAPRGAQPRQVRVAPEQAALLQEMLHA